MSSNRWSNIQKIKERLNGLLTRKVKGIIFSVAASLIVGIVFGMISLQMAEKDGNSAVTANTSVNSDEQTAGGSTFDSVSFYVVQAGIFEKKANAETWAKRFSKEMFPTLKWKRDEKVYLLTGIGSSDEEVAEQAEKMKEVDLNVFVKEWSLSTGELTITAADEDYLKAFLEAWQQSLKEQNNSKLTTFIKSNAEASEAIQPLVDKLEALLEKEKMNEQLFLLEAIYAYENLFQ